MDAGQIAALRRDLLGWAARGGRILPFRADRSPWRVLVAEVALQQTRVDTALPYLQRFLEAWPSPADLAAAPEQEVLRLWQGLGYYGRARRLQAAAREMVAFHGGRVPADPSALRRLPGIGPYIAGAVGSLAFGRDEAALDGNAVRVLARLGRIAWRVDEAAGAAAVAALADRMLPPGAAGRWNEAVMDLGALVCLPRAPRCGACPVAGHCLAHRAGEQAELPLRRPQRRRPEVAVASVVAWSGGWFAVQRRPDRGLLAGMWEFPSVEGASGPEQVCAEFGWRAGPARPVASFRHAFTHRVWRVAAWEVDLADAGPGRGTTAPSPVRWIQSSQLAALPLGRPTLWIAAGAGLLPAKSGVVS